MTSASGISVPHIRTASSASCIAALIDVAHKGLFKGGFEEFEEAIAKWMRADGLDLQDPQSWEAVLPGGKDALRNLYNNPPGAAVSVVPTL